MSIANFTFHSNASSIDCEDRAMASVSYNGAIIVSGNGKDAHDFLRRAVKFEEDVEASSNSLQQIKAEIAALIPALLPLTTVDNRRLGIDQVIRKMRQLSAV